jgi:hypothetical protein
MGKGGQVLRRTSRLNHRATPFKCRKANSAESISAMCHKRTFRIVQAPLEEFVQSLDPASLFMSEPGSSRPTAHDVNASAATKVDRMACLSALFETGAHNFFYAPSGLKARIKIFREEFAMWRQNHVDVSCGHLKHRQPVAG